MNERALKPSQLFKKGLLLGLKDGDRGLEIQPLGLPSVPSSVHSVRQTLVICSSGFIHGHKYYWQKRTDIKFSFNIKVRLVRVYTNKITILCI